MKTFYWSLVLMMLLPSMAYTQNTEKENEFSMSMQISIGIYQFIVERSTFILNIYRRLFHFHLLIKYGRQLIKHKLNHRRT